jgi:Tfp pilus assembly protein PilN
MSLRTIRIDFAPPGWRRTLHRLHPALAVAGLLGVLLCLAGAWTAMDMAEQRAARAAQLEQVQARSRALSKVRATVPETAIPDAQATAVNTAILQLNVPWRELEDALATATPANIALLALDPDARKRILKITAEARNSDDMVGYVQVLKQQEFFSGATLVRHEIEVQDPNKPIRFQVEAQWRGR